MLNLIKTISIFGEWTCPNKDLDLSIPTEGDLASFYIKTEYGHENMFARVAILCRTDV